MKPQRSASYLAWVRKLPCSVCQETRHVEASHTGPHGLSQRSSDLQAIPLCERHHRTGRDSYHSLGPIQFQLRHGLAIGQVIETLNSQWENRR